MIEIIQIIAGILALVGLLALMTGAILKGEDAKKRLLLTFQITMGLSGLILLGAAILIKWGDYGIYGFMLLIFATAVTGFGPKKQAD